MESTGTFATFRRYFPGLFVLLLAIGLGVRVSDQPPLQAKIRTIAENRKSTSLPRFKASDRSAPASSSPKIRKAVSITGADELPITPEEAATELAYIARFESDATRGKATATIIRRLCRSGHTEAAFAAIEKDPGEAREMGITAFFLTAAADDTEIFDRIRNFPDKDDRLAAMEAYLQRVPLHLLKPMLAGSGDLADTFRLALDDVLLRKLSTDEKQQAISLIDELHREGMVGGKLLAQKIIRDDSIDPFEKWKSLFQKLNAEPLVIQDSWKYLLPEMAETDPGKTADFLRKRQTAGPHYDLRYVLSRWIKKDPEAVRNWFDLNQKDASPSSIDAAAWVLAVHAKDTNQPEEAASWLVKVQDPQSQIILRGLLGNPGTGQPGN